MLISLTTFLHGGLSCVLYMMFGRFCFTRRDEDVPLRARTALGIHFLVVSVLSGLRCINMLYGGEWHTILRMFCEMLELSTISTCTFVLYELTRLKLVHPKTVANHFLPLFTLIVLQIVQFWGIEQQIITFDFPVAYWLSIVWYFGYGAYQVYRVKNAAKRYAAEVDDIYADPDGVQISWADNNINRMAIVFTSFFVLVIGFGNLAGSAASLVALDIYLVLSMAIWVSLSNFVDRMRNNSQILTIEEDEEATAQEADATEKAASEETAEPDDAFLKHLYHICYEEGLFKKDGLTRDEVARKMYTNHTYLSNKVKVATGKTFHEYIRDMRLDHACKLLTETNMDFDEIAFECGYRHKASFYRVFSEQLKCTPKEYRKQAAEKQ